MYRYNVLKDIYIFLYIYTQKKEKGDPTFPIVECPIHPQFTPTNHVFKENVVEKSTKRWRFAYDLPLFYFYFPRSNVREDLNSIHRTFQLDCHYHCRRSWNTFLSPSNYIKKKNKRPCIPTSLLFYFVFSNNQIGVSVVSNQITTFLICSLALKMYVFRMERCLLSS